MRPEGEPDIVGFKRELKELLNKYDVSIAFNCSEYSDTHGIERPRIEVDFLSFGKTFKLSDGWFAMSGDI